MNVAKIKALFLLTQKKMNRIFQQTSSEVAEDQHFVEQIKQEDFTLIVEEEKMMLG